MNKNKTCTPHVSEVSRPFVKKSKRDDVLLLSIAKIAALVSLCEYEKDADPIIKEINKLSIDNRVVGYVFKAK